MEQFEETDPEDAWNLLILRLDPEEIDDDDEPSRFIFRMEGSIELHHYDEHDEETVEEVGRFACLSVDVGGAISEDESVFDVFDTHGETFAYFEALYDPEGEWTPAVKEAAFGSDEPWPTNLFVVDKVLIKAAHRGNGYGLAAISALLHRFRPGATGLAMIEPVPAQDWHSFMTDRPPEERVSYRLDEFKESGARATAKLAKHFAKIGFKQVAKTPYMVMHTDRTLPTVDELIGSRAGKKRDLSHLPPPRSATLHRLTPRNRA